MAEDVDGVTVIEPLCVPALTAAASYESVGAHDEDILDWR